VQQPSRTAPLVLTPVPLTTSPVPARFETLAPAASNPPVLTPAVASKPRPPDETPLPFDGSLGTILYGAARKLAIVDGRIVQIGDEIRGAAVVVTPDDAVLL